MRKEQFTVMTLDAGGTNFVFSAINDFNIVSNSVVRIDAPTRGSREQAISAVIEGFELVSRQLIDQGFTPSAISFAFPSPADYENGVICELENLPAFSHGIVPLATILSRHFSIPAFINNDGNLFVYGETLQPFGLLQKLNQAVGCHRYKNLLGLTFGTGFGAGIVLNDTLLLGDNGLAGEINRMRNPLYPDRSVEYSVSSRGIQRVYGDMSLSVEQIYNIATGNALGDVSAAQRAFDELAFVAADAIANAVTMLDCVVVIGGGIAKAYPLFINKIVQHLNSTFKDHDGRYYPRLEVEAYNLEDETQFRKFVSPSTTTVEVDQLQVTYNHSKRIGVGISRVSSVSAFSSITQTSPQLIQDTSFVIALGAYAFALSRLQPS